MLTRLSISLVALFTICFVNIDLHATETQSTKDSNPFLVTKNVNEYGGKLIYRVNTDKAGKYDIILWQCSAKKKDGRMQSYSISINNDSESIVTSGKAGWSFLTLHSVNLRTGANIIAIASDLPQLPAIEFIRVENPAIGKNKVPTTTAYDEYVSNIRESLSRRPEKIGGTSPAETDSLTGAVIDPSENQVPYSFRYFEIPWFGYSFHTTVYLKKGQSFHCVSEAREQQRHFLEIFSTDSPDPYSWTRISTNGKIDCTLKSIPHTGTYFVRVRTYRNGSTGLCNLNVNDSIFYEDVPMCSMGVRSKFMFSTDEYNVFTANCNGDPFMSINKGSDIKGSVWAYNDDYTGEGYFDWGRNARIRCSSSPTANISRIVVLSYSSFNPTGSCELYVGCENYPVDSLNLYRNLKKDDAMISAPCDAAYNCISWTGGITHSREWPPNSKEYGSSEDPLRAFDKFYASERYPGCAKYTRSGATEENSVIDLWGKQTFSGLSATVKFYHASIKHHSDGNHHGYDWESKLGPNERILHPRYALEGDLYGKVLYHYRLSDDSPNNPITLDMALAENRAVMDNVVLSDSQETFLADRISDIAVDITAKFNALYSAWNYVWNNSFHSNPEFIKQEGTAYENLMIFCREYDATKYLVYEKLNRGITSSIPLFEDMYVVPVESSRLSLQSIHSTNENEIYDAEGRQIIRTPLSNLKRLLCQWIPSSPQPKFSAEESISPKDNWIEDMIKIRPTGECVSLSLSLPEISNLNVDLLDHKGEFVRTIIHNQNMPGGNYDFTMIIPKGKLGIVRISINGNIFVKKIML